MIPKVRTWRVRVLDHDGKEALRYYVSAPNKALAHIAVRMDHPNTWGFALSITPQTKRQRR
jgi:hypothetical protein